MKGGYQIIDLRKIGLELKDSQQTISDAEILNQLRGLRDHIEKAHDYKKPLNNSLKPIMIRYRDQKNNEQREVSSFASIISTNNSLVFTIKCKHLQIIVVFEEKTNDDGVKYYDIKSAKYAFNFDETISGNLYVEGGLNVSGDAYFEGEVDLSDATVVGGGTKLYKHDILFVVGGDDYNIYIINNDPTEITSNNIAGGLLETYMHEWNSRFYNGNLGIYGSIISILGFDANTFHFVTTTDDALLMDQELAYSDFDSDTVEEL